MAEKGGYRKTIIFFLVVAAIGQFIRAYWVHSRPENYTIEYRRWKETSGLASIAGVKAIASGESLHWRSHHYGVVPANGFLQLEIPNRLGSIGMTYNNARFLLVEYEGGRGSASTTVYFRGVTQVLRRPVGTWEIIGSRKIATSHGDLQITITNKLDVPQTVRVIGFNKPPEYTQYQPRDYYADNLCFRGTCAPALIPAAELDPILPARDLVIKHAVRGTGLLLLAGVLHIGFLNVLFALFPTRAARRFKKGLKDDTIGPDVLDGFTTRTRDPLKRKQEIQELNALRSETRNKIAELEAELEQQEQEDARLIEERERVTRDRKSVV